MRFVKHKIYSVSFDEPSLKLLDAQRRKTLDSRSALVRRAVKTAFGGWRPIETAPQNDDLILGIEADGTIDVVFYWPDFGYVNDHQVTRRIIGWMPLPNRDGIVEESHE